MKNFFLGMALLMATVSVAQPSGGNSGTNSFSFIKYQKNFPRPSEAFAQKQDTLEKQFKAKGLVWPAKYMYIRSFKYDSELEVWVKNDLKDKFQLFKTYKVCALAGTLGPKRMEGDYQVPEGFYYINEFNPNSNYYLSLGINYPNASDRILSDSLRPGSAIYIHGSCVTVGCIPITDRQIGELYVLAAFSKSQGQDFIPVHIFPVRFDNEKSVNYLEKLTENNNRLKDFSERMENAFDYFEKYKQVPVILIKDNGQYIVNNAPPLRWYKMESVKEKRIIVPHRTRTITELATVVHEWPEFPGGGDAFLDYLKKLGKEVGEFLPKGMDKAFIKMEFIIDKDGVPVNFKVLNPPDNSIDLSEELIIRMEKMGTWKPAILNGKPVAKKMVQTIEVQK